MPVNAFFFDIGSTLIMGPERSPHREIARIINNPDITSKQIAKIIMLEDFEGPSHVFTRLREAFGHIDSGAEESISELWHRQENDAVRIDGALEVVNKLKADGFKIAVISNIWAPYYKAFLKACPEIASSLDGAFLSFKEGAKKPDASLYERALKVLNVSPCDVVMTGDTYKNDIAPAISLGMKTCWLLSRIEHEREALVNVINGTWQKPFKTIGDIKDLMADSLICWN